MADVATPSGAAMFDAAGAEKKPERLEKPERPDEETYKASLKKAEKDHADSMTKFVSSLCCLRWPFARGVSCLCL
jgi:hypothetical protein